MLVQAKLRFRCTACGSTLRVPLHRRGTELNCPRCHHSLRVPLSSETEMPDSNQPDEAPRAVLHTVLTMLRFSAWAVCVGWVSYLIWYYCNPLDLLKGSLPTLSVSLAVGVQLLGAYIAARAVESVSR